MYAVEGLERRAKDGDAPSTADAAALGAIRASPVGIEICEGCTHSRTNAADALARIAGEAAGRER